ncbi:MAG: hypothetical protein MZW92_01740 [Comamonadaceae bacterium]|nr:hypothetical protein [Comamonadaceae bacterium]
MSAPAATDAARSDPGDRRRDGAHQRRDRAPPPPGCWCATTSPARACSPAWSTSRFAIPTLVTGVMLVLLFGPQSLLGGWLARQRVPGGLRHAGHRPRPALHHRARSSCARSSRC